jgi:hypothetical protein
VRPVVSAGQRFRKAVQSQAQAAKGERVVPRPNPVEFTDVNTGERNSVLTPGGMAQVIGYRLKFDPADAAQGRASTLWPRAAPRPRWTWWAATSPPT